jgi:hypothetical protein
MPSRSKTSIYNQAVKISEEYLGPAGERFIRRQISTHIGIEPEALQKNDLEQLVNWVSLAFALLTSNHEEVKSYTTRLRDLGKAR